MKVLDLLTCYKTHDIAPIAFVSFQILMLCEFLHALHGFVASLRSYLKTESRLTSFIVL